MRCRYFGNIKANQPFFKYIKRKITPAEIQEIMQKKVWFAPPALLAGGAASLIFFENGSRIVQYLQPRGIFRFFRQNAPAIAEGEAGVFVGQVVVRRCKATPAKQVLPFRFSKVSQATLSSQFLTTRFTLGA